jgi:uncharacterized delta-60 repeat protein
MKQGETRRAVSIEPLEARRMLTSPSGPSFGDLDFSFGDHGRSRVLEARNEIAGDVLVRPNGNILVARAVPPTADFTSGNVSYLGFVELTSDGTFFRRPGVPFSTDTAAHAILTQRDGKIVVAGEADKDSTHPGNFALARFNADGTIDRSFGVNGGVVTDFGTNAKPVAMTQTSTGEIVVLGSSYASPVDYSHLAIAVYQSDGTLDAGFDADGLKIIDLGNGPHDAAGSTVDTPLGVVATARGGFVVAAESDLYTAQSQHYGDAPGDVRAVLLALRPDGSLDAAFGNAGKALVSLSAGLSIGVGGFARLNDGRFFFAFNVDTDLGSYTSFARFTPTGVLDLAPTTPHKVDDHDRIQQIMSRADGTLFVRTALSLDAYSSDGVFLAHAPASYTFPATRSALAPDGKIVNAGTSTSVDGTDDIVDVSNDVLVWRLQGDAVFTAEHVLGPGTFNDVAVDSVGRIYVAWYDSTSHALMYAVRDKSRTWSAARIVDDASAYLGEYVSIALDSRSLPAVAYQDVAGGGKLKYAHFNGHRWHARTMDAHAGTGFYNSLAFDAAGNPAIAYYDQAKGDLRFAAYSNGTWTNAAIDTAGDSGRYCNLGLNPKSGRWDVAYEQSSTGKVQLARQAANGHWLTTTIDDTAQNAKSISLNYDVAYNPMLAYLDTGQETIKLAMIDPAGAWQIEVLVEDAQASSLNVLPGSKDPAGDTELVYYSGAAHSLNSIFWGDGDFDGARRDTPIVSNSGGAFATAIALPNRKRRAGAFNANVLVWQGADGQLIVQGYPDRVR